MSESPFPEFDPCDMCDHPEHNDEEACEQIIGYGHLTGHQECGCPGSLSQQLDAQRLIGVQMALEAIREAQAPVAVVRGTVILDSGYEAGLHAAERLLEELETQLLSPSPDSENETGNRDDSQR